MKLSFLIICTCLAATEPASRGPGLDAAAGRHDLVETGLRVGPRGPSRWRQLLDYASGRLSADEAVVMGIWTALPDSYAAVRLS